ncbi:MAG: hypothetical protein DHS80DRAFT_29626 [Piptocephalis tieghemiana]|nr:MAG: hypothetical protein DHS80DRAFT_29626 [Piptocephalis tieghemiana]
MLSDGKPQAAHTLLKRTLHTPKDLDPKSNAHNDQDRDVLPLSYEDSVRALGQEVAARGVKAKDPQDDQMGMVKGKAQGLHYPTKALEGIINEIQERTDFTKHLANLVGILPAQVPEWCTHYYPTVPERPWELKSNGHPRRFSKAFFQGRLCKYHDHSSHLEGQERYQLLMDTIYARSYLMIHHVLSPPIAISQRLAPIGSIKEGRFNWLVEQLMNIQLQEVFPLVFLQRQERLWEEIADAHRMGVKPKKEFLENMTWRSRRSMHEKVMDQLMALDLPEKSQGKRDKDGMVDEMTEWYGRWLASLRHLATLIRHVMRANEWKFVESMERWISNSVNQIEGKGKDWWSGSPSRRESFSSDRSSSLAKLSQKGKEDASLDQLKRSLTLLVGPLIDALTFHMQRYMKSIKEGLHVKTISLLKKLLKGYSFKQMNSMWNILTAVHSSFTHANMDGAVTYFYSTEENDVLYLNWSLQKGGSYDNTALQFESSLIDHAAFLDGRGERYRRQRAPMVKENTRHMSSEVGNQLPIPLRAFSALHSIHALGFRAICTRGGSKDTVPRMPDKDVSWLIESLRQALALNQMVKEYLGTEMKKSSTLSFYTPQEELRMKEFLEALSKGDYTYAKSRDGYKGICSFHEAFSRRLSQSAMEDMQTLITTGISWVETYPDRR